MAYFCAMKQPLQRISLLVLALVLLLFGNSVRVWHFCCELCLEHSLEIMYSGNCGPVHSTCAAGDADDNASGHSCLAHPLSAATESGSEDAPWSSCAFHSELLPACYSETIEIPIENVLPSSKYLPVFQWLSALIRPLDLFKTTQAELSSLYPLFVWRSTGRDLLHLHCVLRC